MTKFLNDPLMEESFTKKHGLVYKYSGRVLVELNNICANYCPFCTRKRETFQKEKWELNKNDLSNIFDFLDKKSEIKEVIISGGDPLMSPTLLMNFLTDLEKRKQIKIIRIHTRMPIVAPLKINKIIFKFLKTYKKIIYLSLHCNLVEEIDDECTKMIKKLRKLGLILYSQTVFLKGINDSVEKLQKLFEKLLELGIRPYYLYRCDQVVGLEKFVVPFEKEKEIMTELKKRMSGLACPTYVIDSPEGSGKIPVLLNFWKSENEFVDFNNKLIVIDK